MGLFDIFLSREKQLEKENKLLAKPGHTVAEVVDYKSFLKDEYVSTDGGDPEWRCLQVAEITVRYQMDGQWREERLGPEEGYTGYYAGEQMIVQYDRHGIVRLKKDLRKDSPNRI